VKTVGVVESLWRYPVKSMSGEQMATAFMGFSGIYGDRCFAFRSSAAPKGAPYLSGSVQNQLVRYRPHYRYPERAAAPPNLTDAMSVVPSTTPTNGDENDLALDVVTPSGRVLAIDDPALVESLGEGISETNHLKLVRSDRALTDCRPISLISLQTIRQLETELAVPLDKRRFRANVYAGLTSNRGYEEDEFIGRTLRIGARAMIVILERDLRCKIISLDPDTGEHNPDILRLVARVHDAFAGVYCAVLVEGILTQGDPIQLLD
jgi:uncharacterized protein YcbX